MACGNAWTPARIIGHLKGHNFTLTSEHSEELHCVFIEHGVTENTNIVLPLPGGPPVEGLSITHGGHCCLSCNYCCPSFSAFEKHWSQKHSGNCTPARHAFTLGDIQTFFWPTPQHWFRINPTLALSTLQDPFTT